MYIYIYMYIQTNIDIEYWPPFAKHSSCKGVGSRLAARAALNVRVIGAAPCPRSVYLTEGTVNRIPLKTELSTFRALTTVLAEVLRLLWA